ncbi:hypothetical protein CCH79_00010318 [Gambusia affinis]|uniref:DIX domain-containing protein n=1 Tax=Gambusia affinis TaxID=33528 RepID=A0A315VGQ1_GAMAF|nr:hypothetical protein CCH79_00010318 [Gambusia affinis]
MHREHKDAVFVLGSCLDRALRCAVGVDLTVLLFLIEHSVRRGDSCGGCSPSPFPAASGSVWAMVLTENRGITQMHNSDCVGGKAFGVMASVPKAPADAETIFAGANSSLFSPTAKPLLPVYKFPPPPPKPVPTICFSLSSASPAHSPKEEYLIAQSAEAPTGEAASHRPDNQGETREDKSEPTERKSVPGRSAARETPVEAKYHAISKTSTRAYSPCLFPSEDVPLCGLCPTLGRDGQEEEEKSWEEQLDVHQEQLEKEMQEARRMVFRLQGLLLHGSLPEEDQDGSGSFGDGRATMEQQLVRSGSLPISADLRRPRSGADFARLDQSMEEGLDLKRELLRHKQETRHIQAIKDALQQRLSVQEDAVLQLKQELLRCNMAKDQLEGENVRQVMISFFNLIKYLAGMQVYVEEILSRAYCIPHSAHLQEELKRKLSERNKLLTEYEQQLGKKDRLPQQQKPDESQHKAHEVGHGRTFRGENGGCSNLVVSTSPSTFQHNAQGEELQLVREALRSLRDSFSGHDPQHHTLDTLEQGVASLMDRLHSLDNQRRQEKGEEFKSPGRRANSTDRDSWPPSAKVAHSHSSPGLDAVVSTKVLYFTDRSLTPFLINIPKRLGEVTLRDFKAAVDRQGNFRYHFKALDPEFGTVKEEVFQDGAVVPGWEGKIVAWVEEDHGERR